MRDCPQERKEMGGGGDMTCRNCEYSPLSLPPSLPLSLPPVSQSHLCWFANFAVKWGTCLAIVPTEVQ